MSSEPKNYRVNKRVTPCDSVVFIWDFDKEEIKALVDGEITRLCSPKFYSSTNTFWNAELITKGNFIGVYIRLLSLMPKIATFSVKLLRKSGDNSKFTLNGYEKFYSGGSWGRSSWLKKEDILNDNCIQNGKLKFACTLDVVKYVTIDDEVPIQRHSGLAVDFGRLLESHDYADVMFKVDDKSFLAHRIVLEARSQYFAAMLSGAFEEGKKSAYKVEGVDPDSFEAILIYLYTNQVDFEIFDANNLLVAADKYNLEALVALCEEYLCTGIKNDGNESHVLECFKIADTYSRKKLKEAIVDYIQSNPKKIRNEGGWDELKEENPALAMDVLDLTIKKLAKEKSSKN